MGELLIPESVIFQEAADRLGLEKEAAIRHAVDIHLQLTATLGQLAAAVEREADPGYDPIAYYTEKNGAADG